MIDRENGGIENFLKPDSWTDRNGFAHWVVGVIWIVLAFLLFQVTASVVVIGLLLYTGELQEVQSAAEVLALFSERLDLVFWGNSTGQILFIGLASFLVAKLHLSSGDSMSSFFRLKWREDTPLYLLLGGVLMVVVQPIVIYIGFFNSLIPMPESVSEIQISQYEMFEQFLRQDGIIFFGLLHMALVPAICEEVLFRGYLLSAFEKSWGIVAAIVISSLVFGAFHVQLPNLIPLTVLGAVMAVMTWLSGSVWPAVLAHFVNNGMAVVLGSTYPDLAFRESTAETLPSVWLLLASILLTFFVLKVMLSRSSFFSGDNQ